MKHRILLAVGRASPYVLGVVAHGVLATGIATAAQALGAPSAWSTFLGATIALALAVLVVTRIPVRRIQ